MNLTKFGLVNVARELKTHIPMNNLQVLNFKDGIKYVKTVQAKLKVNIATVIVAI